MKLIEVKSLSDEERKEAVADARKGVAVFKFEKLQEARALVDKLEKELGVLVLQIPDEKINDYIKETNKIIFRKELRKI